MTCRVLFVCRYPDGSVRLRNPNIELMDQDILYHLALGSGSHDLATMFGDVKVSW
jgi:uridine phosphorylase